MALLGACSSPVTTPLAGQTRLEVESLEFPATRVGTESTRTILIYNESQAEVHIQAIEVPNPAFSVLGPTSAISPEDSAQLRLRFQPEATGPISTVATVTMSNETVLRLQLSGTALSLRLTVQPDRLEFGPTILETTTRKDLTLFNGGSQPLDLELTGSDNLQFCDEVPRWATFCIHRAQTIRAGQQVELRIEFTPINVGSRQQARLVVGECPDCAEASLQGEGILRGMTCSPGRLDFGDTIPGQCRSQTITCDNIGNQAVVANLNTPGEPVFRFEGGDRITVRPYEQRSVEVRFCPSERGEASDILTITTDQPEPGQRMQVSLQGRGGGPELAVVPAMLDFGVVPVGSPTRLPLRLSNPGDRTLRVSDARGSNAPVTASGESEIEPGEDVIWWVEANPAAPGAWNGYLTLETDTQTTDTSVQGLAESHLPCTYELPPRVELGSTTPSMPKAGLLRFTNTSNNPCWIHRIDFAPSNTPQLRLLHPPHFPLVMPGQQDLVLEIEMLGDSVSQVEGVLDFTVNNPNEPYAQVMVRGQIIDEALFIAPPAVDFGVSAPTCTTRLREIRLYNTVPAARMLTDLRVSGAGFSIIDGPDLNGGPHPMELGDKVDVQIGFTPPPDHHVTGTLSITSQRDGVTTEQRIPLQGEGSATPWAVEHFVQLDRSLVDLLFVVDFTGCMGQEQTALSQNFNALTRIIQAEQLNYHVGVTTTDTNDEAGRLMHPSGVRGNPFGGPLENRIIHQGSEPSPQDVFEIAALGRNHAGGSAADESPFGAAYLAMQPQLQNGHNAGFLRRDAHLSVLFMADEPEQTSGLIPGMPTADLGFYLDFFRAMKGIDGKSDFRAFSIAGDAPDGCSGPGGNAAPGPRMSQMARDSGGVASSICSPDWHAMLDDLAAPLAGAGSVFFLGQTPELATLQVEVMGTLLPPHAYSYRATDRALVFVEAFIPEPGDLLTVSYLPACP